MSGNSWQYPYNTGWLSANSDWTDRHLGSLSSVDSNLNHRLNAPLVNLLPRLFVSSVSSDTNCWEIGQGIAPGLCNWEAIYVDDNNLLIHTAAGGILSTLGNLTNQNYAYKIKVWYVG